MSKQSDTLNEPLADRDAFVAVAMEYNIRRQFPEFDAEADELTADALKARLDAGTPVTVLDTRRPADAEAWALSYPNVTVVNVPFTEFVADGQPVGSIPDTVPDGPLVVSCAEGVTSRFVGDFLTAAGRENVEVLVDGMEGWAGLYAGAPVEAADTTAEVVQYHRPSSGCLGYLVVDDGEAAVIDPLRVFADRYREDAASRGATLTYAIDTHVHADHISGVHTLGASEPTTPVMPAGAVDRGLEAEARLIEPGERLAVGSVEIEAVSLAGHTTEMTGYRVGDTLVTGDSLFIDGIARPDLEEPEAAREAAERIYDTLEWLAEEPSETLIAPGHLTLETAREHEAPYVGRLGDLRDRLRGFDMDRAGFVEVLLSSMPPRPNNFEEIIAINLGQQHVTEATAFELELGPNNCAASGT